MSHTPVDVAAAEALPECEVIAVTLIRSCPWNVYSSEYLVRWGDGTHSWEPRENLEDCAAFTDFLSAMAEREENPLRFGDGERLRSDPHLSALFVTCLAYSIFP